MIKARLPLLAILALLSIGCLILSLVTGSADIPMQQIWPLLWQDDGSINGQIIHQLRLPRTASAFAVGGLLGLAGALMQVLLRNPLGDPYILGISGGAAVAVLGAILLGIPLFWYTPVAFAGALLSMLLVAAIAHKGEWNATRLLLTGVVIAAGWSAIISFVLSLSPPMQLPGMLFWLMGDLSDALSPALPLSILGIGTILALLLAPSLNIASRGNLHAQALGVDTRKLQWSLYLLASLLTASAVSVAGAIGFIGLIAAHMVRLAISSDHRIVVPGSVLLGGSLLVIADTAARTLIAPMQLPAGVLTAVIGVPIFLLLLNSTSRAPA